MNDVILLGLAGVAVLALFLIIRGVRARNAVTSAETDPVTPPVAGTPATSAPPKE